MNYDLLLDDRHCKLDAQFKCKRCGMQYRHSRVIGMCSSRDRNTIPGSNPVFLYKQPRTKEQYQSVIGMCELCKFYKHKMCMVLVAKKCSQCKSQEHFEENLLRGMGCPKNKFASTDLIPLPTLPKFSPIAVAETAKEQSGPNLQEHE